jgi:hypothetical protein
MLGVARLYRVALVVLVVSLVLGAAIAAWLAMHGVLRLRLSRERAINLVATRGKPRVWFVAHLDSKSQPVPMLARVLGICGSTLAILALFLMIASALFGAAARRDAWIVVTLVGIVATLPVIGSTVGARSPGAVDNASGVATVLRAAALVPRNLAVGVVLTSAEELGMAGARAFASRHGVATAFNVDGVDDRGSVMCMVHGRAPAARVATATAARAIGAPVHFGPTIPGILTDGVALANAGWSAVTLSRGSIVTLARLHREADSLGALHGDGMEDMARLLAAAAREII